MNKQFLIQSVAIVVIGSLSGFAGGELSNHARATVQTNIQQNTNSVPKSIIPTGHVPLTPAPDSVVKAIGSVKVHDANGKLVLIPENRPIFFVAYWAPYSQRALALLAQNNLLDKVQVVSVWYDRSTKVSADNPVHTVNDAKGLMQQGLSKANVSLSTNNILYSLPGDGLDNAINAIPLLLVKKNGQWMELKGYTPDVSSWVDALTG